MLISWQRRLGHGGAGHAALAGKATFIGGQERRTPGQVGGDPDQVHRGPAGPTGVGDPQPLLGRVNHGGCAVEADRPHQRATELGRQSKIMQRPGQSVVLSHTSHLLCVSSSSHSWRSCLAPLTTLPGGSTAPW